MSFLPFHHWTLMVLCVGVFVEVCVCKLIDLIFGRDCASLRKQSIQPFFIYLAKKRNTIFLHSCVGIKLTCK